MMNTFVWVDAWQQQCCGSDFGVGSRVTWSVADDRDAARDRVGLRLGADWADRVGYREEHHEDTTTHTLSGTVLSLREVTCRRRPELRSFGEAWVPIPGSGVLRDVFVLDPPGPELPAEDLKSRSVDGWIVELVDVEASTDAGPVAKPDAAVV